MCPRTGSRWLGLRTRCKPRLGLGHKLPKCLSGLCLLTVKFVHLTSAEAHIDLKSGGRGTPLLAFGSEKAQSPLTAPPNLDHSRLEPFT